MLQLSRSGIAIIMTPNVCKLYSRLMHFSKTLRKNAICAHEILA